MGTAMGWTELYEKARARRGVIVRQDPVECGVDLAVYEARVRRERWDAPYLGTRLLPGTTWGPDVQLMAALWSIRTPVAADFWSAAWVYDIRQTPPGKPMLVVPANRRPRRRDITVRRCQTWESDHITMHNGFWVPKPERLVADLVHDGHDAETMRDVTLALKLKAGLTSHKLRAMNQFFVRLGQRGLLGDLADLIEADGSESGPEYLLRRMLIAAGFRPDDFQLTLGTSAGRRRLDVVFGKFMVGIEMQTTAYHGDLPAMTKDASKSNAFVAGDEWKILVATPEMLTGKLRKQFLADLERVLASQARKLRLAPYARQP